jgi:pSer/pThr/pTyr-binding forkhead associated (FHA) protein
MKEQESDGRANYFLALIKAITLFKVLSIRLRRKELDELRVFKDVHIWTSNEPSSSTFMDSKSTDPPREVQAQTQQNGLSRPQRRSDILAKLYLIPMNGTFERKTITLPFYPDVIRIGRQTNNKTIPTPQNGYFQANVMSRSHAEIWADLDGKVFIRDIKSSNGTYVNGRRLPHENKESDPHELREQDMLELGIDIVSEDQKTVVHHKVAARVEHAGFLYHS